MIEGKSGSKGQLKQQQQQGKQEAPLLQQGVFGGIQAINAIRRTGVDPHPDLLLLGFGQNVVKGLGGRVEVEGAPPAVVPRDGPDAVLAD